MKITTLTLIILLLFVNTIYAQFDFREGYIINQENDTITGYIDYVGKKLSAKKCLFKTDISAKSQSFTPTQIKAYRFLNSKYYVSKEITKDGVKKNYFLEYLINGIVDIYYYEDNLSENYMVDTGNGELIRLDNDVKEVVINDKKFIGNSQVFRQTLQGVFKESPTILKRIKNLSLGHKSIINITSDYHNEVCFDQACIIYEKKKVAAEKQFGISIGMNSYSIVDNDKLGTNSYFFKDNSLGTSVSPSIGVYYKSNLPSLNERFNIQLSADITQFSFKSNVIGKEPLYNLTQIDDLSFKQFLLNAALLIKYQFPKGKIRPTLQIGGFADMALSSEYYQHYQIIGNSSEVLVDQTNIESPFSKFYAGLTAGIGFNFTAFNIKNIFIDFNFRKAPILDKGDGLNANVYLVQIGIPLTQ